MVKSETPPLQPHRKEKHHDHCEKTAAVNELKDALGNRMLRLFLTLMLGKLNMFINNWYFGLF